LGLRFFGVQGDDRLLVVNLGRDLARRPAPEPLLAPPKGMRWTMLWSSEDPRYEGGGTAPLAGKDDWQIPAPAAVVLRPMAPAEPEDPSLPSS
jgi:maltooligosyltrehalose trehalohydrolase